jgi:hypothetical protein
MLLLAGGGSIELACACFLQAFGCVEVRHPDKPLASSPDFSRELMAAAGGRLAGFRLGF